MIDNTRTHEFVRVGALVPRGLCHSAGLSPLTSSFAQVQGFRAVADEMP